MCIVRKDSGPGSTLQEYLLKKLISIIIMLNNAETNMFLSLVHVYGTLVGKPVNL